MATWPSPEWEKERDARTPRHYAVLIIGAGHRPPEGVALPTLLQIGVGIDSRGIWVKRRSTAKKMWFGWAHLFHPRKD